jgi:uncharacterized membrane protein YeaQ/YmgE (transglycosylase-associated protein family)
MFIVGIVVGAIARFIMSRCRANGTDHDRRTRHSRLVRRRLHRPTVLKAAPGAPFHPAGILLSIIGAVIVLFAWQKLAG